MPLGEGVAVVGFAILVAGVVLVYLTRRDGDDQEAPTLDVQNHRGDDEVHL